MPAEASRLRVKTIGLGSLADQERRQEGSAVGWVYSDGPIAVDMPLQMLPHETSRSEFDDGYCEVANWCEAELDTYHAPLNVKFTKWKRMDRWLSHTDAQWDAQLLEWRFVRVKNQRIELRARRKPVMEQRIDLGDGLFGYLGVESDN